MKRKAETQLNGGNGKGILKKRAKAVLTAGDVHACFRKGLFAKGILDNYTKEYAASTPYKHSVISSLINDKLLRSVRDEVRENVHFTPKETDIYKIHQSGDLANLDGLEDGALERLPSLLKLRDAMYSVEFRKYVAAITGSGELSGRKTDMAINVYTPGCHLLCHDDVIGSRRVSYILYLTDPDVPWKEEWGGALRLFPTKTFEDEDGEKTVTPSPDYSKVIPPAWNQLSFFAVQPGESFHDVEEVYHAQHKEQLAKEGGRIRMAISGWYHIPQIGEEGYVKGAEEKWGKNSSLMQLQGHPDRYDFPHSQVVTVESESESEPSEEKGFEEEEVDFLLKYMAPTYLTPDTMEQVRERFVEESSVTLETLLSKKFSARVREYIEAEEKSAKPESSEEIEKAGVWKVAKPPHKHRFLYRQQPSTKTPKSNGARDKSADPIQELLSDFLPSPQFRKWLEIATDCVVENHDILARRFRRGMDYSLATGHEGDSRLEITLGLTPTTGWGGEEETEEEAEGDGQNGDGKPEPPSKSEKGKKASKKDQLKQAEKLAKEEQQKDDDEADVGGHEVYMAADVEDDNEDAAIYKSSSQNNDPSEEDDSILFTTPANWNKLSIVLRDSGVLKFVKYVSRSAKGDRWDICGAFGVRDLGDDSDGEDEEGEEEGGKNGVSLDSSGEEDVFNGFPESDDGDSDSD